MKLELTVDNLADIREYIVQNIMRNPDIMFSETREGETDFAEVIASLYELLHQMVTGETYRYMFHWANKCGAWVEDGLFDKYTLDKRG